MSTTPGASLIPFRYDATGKCLDCGGFGGCHSLKCASDKQAAGRGKLGVPHCTCGRPISDPCWECE